MLAQALPVIPPAPKVHVKDLPALRHLLTAQRNSLEIFPGYAFEVPFARRSLLGIDAVLVNDPAGVRHVLATNAANYVRPTFTPRVARPLIGDGLFLAEGSRWRQQRRMLSPVFTPHNVGALLPHFSAAADNLAAGLDRAPVADLSAAFQDATLDAVLRALFSMPDSEQRAKIGVMVRSYVTGPGRPNILDALARTEDAFSFASAKRRAFQRAWFATVDEIVGERRRLQSDSSPRDLLDLLLAARDADTGEVLSPTEVRDQCATMIFGGFETTARILFWASYLLTLDLAEQERLRAEVRAFSPDCVTSLDDLGRWPRLRMTLLEALRLYPPVAHIVREAVADDEILGEPVHARGQIWVSPRVIHRHRKLWEYPTAFMPERFAGKPSPWTANAAYLPFGSGPRTCIGATFAMCEAQIMLATLLIRYRISSDDPRPVLPVARVTIEPSYAPMFHLEKICLDPGKRHAHTRHAINHNAPSVSVPARGVFISRVVTVHDALVDIEGNIPPANVRGATSYCSETRMSVVECDVPSESALGKALIERADFRDAYRAPLRRPEAGVIEIFFAIFAHRPAWMNLILIARNKVAGFAGLETPTIAEILNIEKRDRYIVGQKIGPWPIFFLGPDELIAGRDNKHMDFRLSIMRVRDRNGPSVVVSTLCMVRNRFGRYYLSSITPFHKFGLRKLMASALAAQRL